jgi:hypothetical protein
MNAKFEKWWADQIARNGGIYIGADYNHWAGKGWQAALQSLEVSPELVDAAKDGLFGSSYCDLGYQGYIGDAAIHEALTAVFNAIKEQAK